MGGALQFEDCRLPPLVQQDVSGIPEAGKAHSGKQKEYGYQNEAVHPLAKAFGREPAGCHRSPHGSVSVGSRFFLAVLQALHTGMTFPLVLFPPRAIGTMWSMVNSDAGVSAPQ
jgi:hypothetical protein